MGAQTAMLSIGEVAQRSGVRASALRFYEALGLLRSTRSGGKRRYFARSELRRIAFIRAAQAVGLTLDEIRTALAALPQGRTPTKTDWEKLSRGWRGLIDERIARMTALRDTLSSCIGCGCLSLKSCALYNSGDAARALGDGPRYLLGDTAADAENRRLAGGRQEMEPACREIRDRGQMKAGRRTRDQRAPPSKVADV